MATIEVKYQCKHVGQTTYSSGNTIIRLDETTRTAVKDYLLSRNPNWSDVRIVSMKVK